METTKSMEKTTSKSEKGRRIVYWIFTIWMALGMTSTGIVQLLGAKEEAEMMDRLGYPDYFMTLLGAWKLLGVIAVLSPKLLLLKEWAYAGFFFVMSGAVLSHIAAGDTMGEIFPALLLLTLTVISWWFRPAGRKIATS